MKNTKKISTVFILSSGRSGSTLLSNLLNAHSKLLSVPESTFLITLTCLYRNKTRFKDKDYQKIIDIIWLRKSTLKILWNIDESALLATFQKEKPQSLDRILQLIYLSYNGAGAKKASIIIDKSPFYLSFIHRIKEVYPKAKYIFLVRDYRDRYLSLKNTKYANEVASKIVRGISWNTVNEKLLKMYNKAKSDTVLFVKYEDLILSPEIEVRKICQFLNVAYEKTMFDFHKTNPHDYSSIEASENLKNHIINMHKNSNTKVNSDKVGVWKKKLDKKTLSTLETFCGKTGELLGYKKSTKNTQYKNLTNRFKLLPKIIKGFTFRFLRVRSFCLPYPIQKKVVQLFKPK